MDIIDCHSLVVSPDRTRYPFAAEAPPPSPGELENCLDVSGLWAALQARTLSGAVLVQRNRFYGYDNRLICDLVRCSPALRALCSVDGRRPDCAAFAETLIARDGAFGLRFMEPEKGADLAWLAGDHARAAWRVAADLGAIIDIHVFPWNRTEALTALLPLLDSFGQVPVLLDNLGNGPVGADVEDFGIDDLLRRIIAHPNVTHKVSDMTISRIEKAGLNPALWMERFAKLAGAERLVWGSDVLPAGRDLAQAAARALSATATLSTGDQRAVLRDTAARIFGFMDVQA
ncbi:MAG: amidohydrolase [Sphingomonadales bacterium]|nr:amidohydrolase [Sphingomonadales bacterium]